MTAKFNAEMRRNIAPYFLYVRAINPESVVLYSIGALAARGTA